MGFLGVDLSCLSARMVFSLSRTIDIRVDCFPAGTSPDDILNYVHDYFAKESLHKVVSIQQVPGLVARVTFVSGGEVAKLFSEERGSVNLNGVECQVIAPPPPLPRLV